MSRFNDPKTGVGYLGSNANLSASFAASGDNKINGILFEPSSISQIPARLDNGDQAKFVDLTKVVTGSGGGVFREPLSGLVYVPFKKKDIQDSLIGENSHIKNNFLPDSYLQISKSFANRFKSIGDDIIFNYLVEEFYTGSTEGFVGVATASMSSFTPDGLTSSFSGIDNGNGYDMTFDFGGSNFVTNQLIAFPLGGDANTLRTATFIEKFQHRFIHEGSNRTNIALITSSLASVNGVLGVDASAVSPPSGSNCGVGTLSNINGTNADAGTFSSNQFKGRVAGDGDSGSLATTYDNLLPSKEYIIYPRGTVVASASYHFLPNTGNFLSTAARAAAVTSSATIKEVFFASGSTNDVNGRVGGAHTGSAVLNVAQGFGGSPAHADPLLQTTASMGFYCLSGSQGNTSVIINVITSSRDNSGNNLGAVIMEVPRFIERVPL